MDSRERVLKTLDFEEPDRVPIFELAIDLPHMETITGNTFERAFSRNGIVANLVQRQSEMAYNCYKKLGFDIIVISSYPPKGWQPEKNPEGTIIGESGTLLSYDSICKKWVSSAKTIFKTPEEWDNFSLPDPHAPGRFEGLEGIKKLNKGELLLAGRVQDPFAVLWGLFSPRNFVKWMYRNIQFIKRMYEKVTAHNVEMISLQADYGAELIVCGGDWCEINGPMVPIKFFKDVILPNLQKQVDASHKKGLKLIKHTDGNIMPLLEHTNLSDIVDGMHSLDPTASVDIGEVKRRYGDKFVLCGNITNDNLARKSKMDIIHETKECIRKASPGGGHILSSSNTWYTGTKLENCLAMVETGKKFGIYPINF